MPLTRNGGAKVRQKVKSEKWKVKNYSFSCWFLSFPSDFQVTSMTLVTFGHTIINNKMKYLFTFVYLENIYFLCIEIEESLPNQHFRL